MKTKHSERRFILVALLAIVFCLTLWRGNLVAVELRPGFPVWSDELAGDGNIGNSMINYDYDSDGEVETIVFNNAILYFINSEGGVEQSYDTGYRPGCPGSPPSIADIDADGQSEIVFCARMLVGDDDYPAIYVIKADMSLQSPFPVPIWDHGGTNAPPVLYDLDGDGFQEILAGTNG
jgi:hypothetical protein